MALRRNMGSYDPRQPLCPLSLPCLLWTVGPGGVTDIRIVTGFTKAGEDSNYLPPQLLMTWVPL